MSRWRPGCARFWIASATPSAAPPILIGTAGWSIPTPKAGAFSGPGSHLERYGRHFDAVEINSSFYRPHRRATYERWAASVPDHFRFAVKLPKSITHRRRLSRCDDLLERFAGEVTGLGEKFGALLIQLPPSLAFSDQAAGFLQQLRLRFAAALVCEPRHASWFTADVDRMLSDQTIARVAADPPPVPGADRPGGENGTAYFRLHGSPEIYRSNYGANALEAWTRAARESARSGAATWVIFDNTADGAAIVNAAEMIDKIGPQSPRGV